MPIDLTQVQSQVVDRLQSEVVEQAQRGAGNPNDAARFAELMDKPDAAAGAGTSGSSPVEPGSTQAPSAARLDAAATVGDRILANMANPVQTQPGAADAVRGEQAIDAADPAELMAMQAEVVEVKTTTALAVGVVHKTTQGVDTLLKTQ
ncbi:MAG: hypothetical protein OXG44_16725 [Gammaproteobacteria bacterium]|nr:hypothetical protein [Gammaproteobacteria bacterium]